MIVKHSPLCLKLSTTIRKGVQDSYGVEQEPVVGSSEHGNEFSRLYNEWGILGSLSGN
jgi:hypothetical protein